MRRKSSSFWLRCLWMTSGLGARASTKRFPRINLLSFNSCAEDLMGGPMLKDGHFQRLLCSHSGISTHRFVLKDLSCNRNNSKVNWARSKVNSMPFEVQFVSRSKPKIWEDEWQIFLPTRNEIELSANLQRNEKVFKKVHLENRKVYSKVRPILKKYYYMEFD